MLLHGIRPACQTRYQGKNMLADCRLKTKYVNLILCTTFMQKSVVVASPVCM